MKKLKILTAVILLFTSMTLVSCDELVQMNNINENSETSSKSETNEISKIHEIGEMITIDEWEITVDKIEITDKILGDYNTVFTPDDGNKFLFTTLTIKNTATEMREFLPIFSLNDDIIIKVIYQDKYEYSGSTLMAYSEDLHMSSLNPLTSKTGILAFQIVEEAANNLDDVVLNFYLGKTIETYKTN